MSLKDLLPPGTFEEIAQEANYHQDNSPLIKCPHCQKSLKYDINNPYRPFCSERCKILDLGAWANEEHSVKGKDINLDEDADLLNDPSLPIRGKINCP